MAGKAVLRFQSHRLWGELSQGTKTELNEFTTSVHAITSGAGSLSSVPADLVPTTVGKSFIRVTLVTTTASMAQPQSTSLTQNHIHECQVNINKISIIYSLTFNKCCLAYIMDIGGWPLESTWYRQHRRYHEGAREMKWLHCSSWI